MDLDEFTIKEVLHNTPLEKQLDNLAFARAIYNVYLRRLMIFAESVVACCYGKTYIRMWTEKNPGKFIILLFTANDWAITTFDIANYQSY